MIILQNKTRALLLKMTFNIWSFYPPPISSTESGNLPRVRNCAWLKLILSRYCLECHSTAGRTSPSSRPRLGSAQGGNGCCQGPFDPTSLIFIIGSSGPGCVGVWWYGLHEWPIPLLWRTGRAAATPAAEATGCLLNQGPRSLIHKV